MKSKKEQQQKIFCIGEELVIVNGDEIIPINLKSKGIDENVILDALNERLAIRPIPPGGPYEIFRKTMEDIIGIPFCSRGFKYDGKSIHDSEFYRKYLTYISESLRFKEKNQVDKERKERIAEYWKTEGVYSRYCKNKRRMLDDKEALHKKKGYLI